MTREPLSGPATQRIPPAQHNYDITALLEHGEWQDVQPGIQAQVLVGAVGLAESTALLRYAAGAALGRHRHSGLEQIFVLRGSQSDEQGTYEAGSLVLNARGSSHTVFSRDGCIVLVTWHGDIEFG